MSHTQPNFWSNMPISERLQIPSCITRLYFGNKKGLDIALLIVVSVMKLCAGVVLKWGSDGGSSPSVGCSFGNCLM